jgi:hypothetical protein
MSHTPAEARAIDRHHRVGSKSSDGHYGFAHASENQRRSRQHFGDTGNSQIAQWHQTFEPFFPHALAANSGDPEVSACALPQSRNQSAAQRVTGRFAGNEENEWRSTFDHE